MVAPLLKEDAICNGVTLGSRVQHIFQCRAKNIKFGMSHGLPVPDQANIDCVSQHAEEPIESLEIKNLASREPGRAESTARVAYIGHWKRNIPWIAGQLGSTVDVLPNVDQKVSAPRIFGKCRSNLLK